MALIIFGKTKCALCAQTIEQGDEIAVLPSIVMNEEDPLWPLNDSAMHHSCVLADEKRDAIAMGIAGSSKIFPHNRLCSICGREIMHPDELIVLGYFTGEKTDPMFQYNFRQFHNNCLHNDDQLVELQKLLRANFDAGSMRGKSINWLLEKICVNP